MASVDLKPLERIMTGFNDLLSKKEVVGIIITGTTQSGTFTQQLNPVIKLNPNATHQIYLQSLSAWENIPNVKKGVNDNFTYVNSANQVRSLTIPPGAYQLSDIYSYIQSQMTANGDYNGGANVANPYYINFNTFLPTQQVQITLTNNYQVDFRPATSVASILGFGNVLLTGNNTVNGSTALVDILPSQSINVNCSIATGFYFNGTVSNIIYSFNNSTPRGYMIDERPVPTVPCICNTKTISSITISFTDENNNPINFNGEQFCVRLVIQQI
jgi:hypothetical protein